MNPLKRSRQRLQNSLSKDVPILLLLQHVRQKKERPPNVLIKLSGEIEEGNVSKSIVFYLHESVSEINGWLAGS